MVKSSLTLPLFIMFKSSLWSFQNVWLFFFFFFWLTWSSYIPRTSALYEKDIKNFLETWRMRMCHPLPNVHVPAMDPFSVRAINYSIHDNNLYDLDVNVVQLNLTGIAGFDLKQLRVALPPITSNFELHIPRLEFDILYNAFGTVGDLINLNTHSQKMRLTLDGFNLLLSWKFPFTISIGIKNLEIDMDFQGLRVDFGRITGDQKVNSFLNNAFNELGLGFLQDFWLTHKENTEKLIEKEINNAVNGLSVLNIFHIITHIKNNGLDEKVFQNIDPDCSTQSTITFP